MSKVSYIKLHEKMNNTSNEESMERVQNLSRLYCNIRTACRTET